jgi:hypothetical protein
MGIFNINQSCATCAAPTFGTGARLPSLRKKPAQTAGGMSISRGSFSRCPHEAMVHIVCVDVVSRDRPSRVVAYGLGALVAASDIARAGSIERGEYALGKARKAW